MAKRNSVRDGKSAAPTHTYPVKSYYLQPGDIIAAGNVEVSTVDRVTCKNHVHINERYCLDALKEVDIR